MQTILIIDDHALFRTGLGLILAQNATPYRILEAPSVMDAISLASQEIDLVLLDIEMPGLNGLEGLKVIGNRFPAVPVVMISASDAAQDRRAALDRGAAGFLHKSASAEDISACLAAVFEGKSGFGSSIRQLSPGSEKQSAFDFTPRQLEVLSLLCQGKSNKLIARSLGMAENTVRVHVSAILSILGASSRTEASLLAQQQNIISIRS